jgi:hypothetical protein
LLLQALQERKEQAAPEELEAKQQGKAPAAIEGLPVEKERAVSDLIYLRKPKERVIK